MITKADKYFHYLAPNKLTTTTTLRLFLASRSSYRSVPHARVSMSSVSFSSTADHAHGPALTAALDVALRASPSLGEKVAASRRAAAAGTLVIVSDFDHTLTTPDSEQCHGIVGLHAPSSSSEYRKAMAEILDLSNPRTAALTRDEWWTTCHDVMVRHRLTRDDLRNAVDAAPCRPRAGAAELLRACASARAPVLVVSAGISDVVEDLLVRRWGIVPDGSEWRVSANRMVFDDDDDDDENDENNGGRLVSFAEATPLHSGTKHLTAERERDFLFWRDDVGGGRRRRTVERVVVLGDKPHDVDAARGIVGETSERLLRVGFYGDPDPDGYSLEEFEKVYDLVLPSATSGLECVAEIIRSGSSTT